MLTQWIIRRIPDYENVKDERVRSAYGKAASLVGIGCNVLLFAGKLVAGLLSSSVAIMADAVNNLSDASSSLISLLGFKLADSGAAPQQRRQNFCARADCVQLGERRRAGRVHRGQMLDGGVQCEHGAAHRLDHAGSDGQRQPKRRDYHRRGAAVHDDRAVDRAGFGRLCRRGGGLVHPRQRRFAD